jgi:glyoxylase-like metal-dependent hydrolase (beta-lactamase superfamily II)
MKHILPIAIGIFLFHHSAAQIKAHFIDSVEAIVLSTKEDVIKIKENYYAILPEVEAPNGNIGVYIGKEYVVLVDDQWSVLSPRIKEIVKKITDKPIKYVINTHYHFDHTDGNKSFGKEGVIIIAHSNSRKQLSTDMIISGAESEFGKILQKAYSFEGLPSITFSDSMELCDDQETIKIIHPSNAHTDGDAIVHFEKADIYHTGDIFVTYGVPAIDEDSGGDYYGMIKIIDYLISVSNSETKFIPGHGSVCSVNELIAYRSLLNSIKDQIIDLMKKGLPLERIINEVKIDENVGGFKKEFISHVYRMILKDGTNDNSQAQSNAHFKEIVKKTHQGFIDGILAEDYKLVDQLLAEDVTLGFPNGGFTTKQEFIGALKNKTLFYDSSANLSSNIRIYGNTGVVNGRGDLVFRYKDEKGQWFKMLEHLSYTAVYVIDKNKVKMMAWQSNRPTTDTTEKIEK